MSHPMFEKNVTIFMGSPRKNSNTHLLARESERALCEQGVYTDMVFLDDLAIRDCQACHRCKMEGEDECVINDDMQAIYPFIRKSDGLIVAAPVYFGYVPAMTKAWLDRLVPCIGMDLVPKISGGKRISFIFTQNMPDAGLFAQSLKGFTDSVAMTGLVVQDFLIVPDCEAGQKPMVTERPDVMARAYTLGRDLLAKD